MLIIHNLGIGSSGSRITVFEDRFESSLSKEHRAFAEDLTDEILLEMLSELAMTFGSTWLAIFNYQSKNAGLNTWAASINQLREKGLGANLLAVMNYEAG